MMTWKDSSLRGLREVGSAKERFCFFDIAKGERSWIRKGMQQAAGERPGAALRHRRFASAVPEVQTPVTRRWCCKAAEALGCESFWEMSTVVTMVRRRWEGGPECDSGRIVLPVSVFVKTASGIRLRRNDDEDSIWHSGFIRQHSAGDCGGAKHCCAPGGTATEISTRGGSADGSGRGCGGSALSVELMKTGSRVHLGNDGWPRRTAAVRCWSEATFSKAPRYQKA